MNSLMVSLLIPYMNSKDFIYGIYWNSIMDSNREDFSQEGGGQAALMNGTQGKRKGSY